MEVIITEWGFQSYLNHRANGVFSDSEYKRSLRPDAELLKTDDPFDQNHPRFSNSKFWRPAKYLGKITPHGFKMKWHNFGNGNVQFRLCIVIAETDIGGIKKKRAFICTAYIKDDKTEKSEMAKLLIHIARIFSNNVHYKGSL